MPDKNLVVFWIGAVGGGCFFWYLVGRSVLCLCVYRPSIPPPGQTALTLSVILFLIAFLNLAFDKD